MADPRRRRLIQALGSAPVAATLASGLGAAAWPSRPISLVVGYRPGGGTDFVARLVAPMLEALLDTPIKVLNQPGATGSVATDFIWNQPADGHWWLMTSGFNRGLRASGLHHTVPYRDWQFHMADTTVMSLSVRPDSPLADFGAFLDRCRRQPDAVRVSNSGVGGSWHLGCALIKEVAGIDFIDVPYKGGKPAVLACLNGEVDVVASGYHEQVDLIESGHLRNLCICADDEAGSGTPPGSSILGWLPALRPHTPFGGGSTMALRRDTDPAILRRVAEAWTAVTASAEFRTRELGNSRRPTPATGGEADRRAALWECVAANLLHRTGNARSDPQALGLPAIADFGSFWPPTGYQPAF